MGIFFILPTNNLHEFLFFFNLTLNFISLFVLGLLFLAHLSIALLNISYVDISYYSCFSFLTMISFRKIFFLIYILRVSQYNTCSILLLLVANACFPQNEQHKLNFKLCITNLSSVIILVLTQELDLCTATGSILSNAWPHSCPCINITECIYQN